VLEVSAWSTQMVRLLRQLMRGLSDTVAAWDKFKRKDIWYFLHESESSSVLLPLQSSVHAVDHAFLDLKDFLEKLRHLERELCQDNPQGVGLLSLLLRIYMSILSI
jgi:hypothetical protein